MIELDLEALAEDQKKQDADTIICGACGQDVIDCECSDGPTIDIEELWRG